jgi:PAS domain S-box-containing protein
VVQHGQIIRADDLANDERYFETLPGMKSGLYVPIKLGDHVIGVISIESETPGAFSEPDERLTNTLANQAASALENARLFDETAQRINELSALHRTGQQLLAARLNPEEIFTAVHKTVAETMPCEAFVIVLNDEDRGDYHAAYFFDKGERFPARRLPRGEGISGRVISSGETLLIDDTAVTHIPATHFGSMESTRSILAVPLRRGNEVIGMLSTQSYQPHVFGESQRVLLETITAQLSSALDNAHLYQQTEARIRELETLYDTSKVLAAEYDLDALLEVIVKRTQKMLNSTTSGMYLYDAESGELELTMDTSPTIPIGTRLRLGEGLAGKVAETRQPVRIEDYSSWDGRLMQFDSFPIHAVIEVPMLYAGELIGVLTADETGDSNRKFTKSDERLLSLFASQAAGAINAARHRKDTIRYAEELEKRVSDRTAEIETTRQRLDLAASAGGIGVWEVNLKDYTVFWDTRMHMIHGTGAADFDNSLVSWWKMFHPQDVKRSQLQFKNALQKTGQFMDEYRVLLPDGSTRHIASNAVVLYDEDHRPERMIGVNMDITQRKQAEETLHRANLEMERALRTKDEFLANMSHELRTPLNAILGISESLEEQFVGPLNEKQLKYTGIIRESGRHLLELINDILDISKIEAGRMELELQNISVEKVCQSSLRMIKELAQKKEQNVSFEIKGGVKIILGDDRRLKQSLVNLLGNAVKFTPRGGAIGLEVNGRADTNEVTFTVWDKGVGIAHEDIQYLFKPFVQLDAGLAREYQGTGLGLALVAQMIRLHGGSVKVESVVGQGSRFIITLPWTSEQQNASLKVTDELPRLSFRFDRKRKGKILIVEDTDVVITLMSEYLNFKGYKVLAAQNGMEGVHLAKKEHPDLILMDVMMPVMDGLEAARQIRADSTLQDVPIIALTAMAMRGDREICIAAGMNDYMSKPIRMQELADMIEKHMGNGGQAE